MTHIELYLKREAEKYDSSDLYDIYEGISNDSLRKILSYIHAQLNHWFVTMNSNLRIAYDEKGNKIYNGGYFHAQDSRDLLAIFDILEHLKSKLRSTSLEFNVCNNNYDDAIRRCKRFLVGSGGSTIPEDFKPIEIEDVEPIFQIKNTIQIETGKCKMNAELKFIGEGSYANVFSYVDPNYKIHIALKRAKVELDNKELIRFRQEFNVLKSLKSPYIVQVFNYNENDNSYTMEFMDESIYDFIERHNAQLTLNKRKGIITQICRGLEYMHSKGFLHRDISLTNVFVKHYDDIDVVKIGDFGLVKIPTSSLTSVYSEIKGSLNDPDLINVGFSNYEMCHETYALTRLCYYILTGRTNITKQKNGLIKDFWNKGTSTHREDRFKSVQELNSFVQKITDSNK